MQLYQITYKDGQGQYRDALKNPLPLAEATAWQKDMQKDSDKAGYGFKYFLDGGELKGLSLIYKIKGFSKSVKPELKLLLSKMQFPLFATTTGGQDEDGSPIVRFSDKFTAALSLFDHSEGSPIKKYKVKGLNSLGKSTIGEASHSLCFPFEAIGIGETSDDGEPIALADGHFLALKYCNYEEVK